MLRNIGARWARIIREGLMSLLQAIKMVLFPPAGADSAQVWHEALKLIAAGVIVAGGVLLEELVTKVFPGSALVSGVVTAVLTGFATAIVMYGLDRLDLFGSMAGQRQTFLFQELDKQVATAMAGAEGSLA